MKTQGRVCCSMQTLSDVSQMNAEPQSLCHQVSLNISIFYHSHNAIVYLVFVALIQVGLFEENSAVTNNHTLGEELYVIAVNIYKSIGCQFNGFK